MMYTQEQIKETVSQHVQEKYGRVDEQLMSNGIIDSMGAVELAFTLGKKYDIKAEQFGLSDMGTLTSISKKIYQALLETNEELVE